MKGIMGAGKDGSMGAWGHKGRGEWGGDGVTVYVTVSEGEIDREQ